MANKVQIDIIGDASKAKKAFGEVHSAAGTLGGTITKLAGAFAGLYVVDKTVDFLKDSAKAAMEDAKAKEVLHTAIRNVTGATEDELTALDAYIEKTQAATGYTEEELRPAMVKLTTATGDTKKAQELLAIAMDTATARGASLDTIVTALEKAQNGNVTSLQRLGIATKDAAGETLSFDEILVQLGKTYGGATAAAADTFQGKMDRMKLVFGEIKESVGAAMLPALEKIASVITDNMPTFESLGKTFGEVIAGALDIVSKVALPLLRSVFETVWPILQNVMQRFIDFFNSDTGQKLITTLLKGIETAVTVMSDVFTRVMDALAPALGPLIDAVLAVIQPILDQLGDPNSGLRRLIEKVSETFTTVIGALAPLLGPLVGAVVKVLEPILNIALKIIDALVWIMDHAANVNNYNGVAGSTAQDYRPGEVGANPLGVNYGDMYGEYAGPYSLGAQGAAIPIEDVGAAPAYKAAQSKLDDFYAKQMAYNWEKWGDNVGGKNSYLSTKDITINVSGTGGLDLGRQIAGILATV